MKKEQCPMKGRMSQCKEGECHHSQSDEIDYNKASVYSPDEKRRYTTMNYIVSKINDIKTTSIEREELFNGLKNLK